MKDFTDKVVVVTGAGSGIGRATANVFSELGSELALADVNADRLDEVRTEVTGKGAKAESYEVDVASRAEMEDFSSDVLARHGRVDVLVNNAGVALGGELVETTLEAFELCMGINFWGVVHGAHFFSPHMIERGSGHIVNIASINGIAAMPFNGPYNASKFAVMGYSASLRMEYANLGVGVTAVCPGLINTNIAKDRRGGRAGNPDVQTHLEKFQYVMAKKGANPRRVAEAIPRAIRKNKAVCTVPFDATMIAWLHRLLPGVWERGCCKMVRGEPVPLP